MEYSPETCCATTKNTRVLPGGQTAEGAEPLGLGVRNDRAAHNGENFQTQMQGKALAGFEEFDAGSVGFAGGIAPLAAKWVAEIRPRFKSHPGLIGWRGDSEGRNCFPERNQAQTIAEGRVLQFDTGSFGGRATTKAAVANVKFLRAQGFAYGALEVKRRSADGFDLATGQAGVGIDHGLIGRRNGEGCVGTVPAGNTEIRSPAETNRSSRGADICGGDSEFDELAGELDMRGDIEL